MSSPPAELDLGLETRFVGRRIHRYSSVVSTNAVCWEFAARGEPEGSVIVSDEQTGGRGRAGRSWHSPAGMGVWASVLLSPGLPADRVSALSIVTALSVAEALRSATGADVGVKWPNDIVAGGRKLGGVLVEAGATQGDPVESAVVGIGIDVNQTEDDFPLDIRGTATSLRILTGAEADRDAVLAAVLTRFEEDYLSYLNGGLAAMRERWRSLSATLGRRIEVDSGGERHAGGVVDVSPEGALVIEEEGSRVEIWHGDVTLAPRL
jgi:BirA family biotin operon repressor/biotin-[acetyl-CoA-carboxylase] ligase